MNKCSVVVLILLVFLGVSTMNAQPRPERPPMPSPEEIAQRKTEKMDKEISLDDNQFKKILTPEQYQRFRTIHPDPTEFFIK